MPTSSIIHKMPMITITDLTKLNTDQDRYNVLKLIQCWMEDLDPPIRYFSTIGELLPITARILALLLQTCVSQNFFLKNRTDFEEDVLGCPLSDGGFVH